MSINMYLSSLVQYGIDKGLIEECDRKYIINQLLQHLKLDSYMEAAPKSMPLELILQGILDDAVVRGLCSDSIASRDLLDNLLMGLLTPPPRDVRRQFSLLRSQNPPAATDWFYRFCQDTGYIRKQRIQRDFKWISCTEYGNMDITINLSRPEKAPRANAMAKSFGQPRYPKCQLCVENEGYAGREDYPARQNHRVIPITLASEQWYFQFSPYAYYNEHCIVFNSEHTPMKIDRSTFIKLLDFVTLFPHYFLGSNAELPSVGGSIPNHEHYQGGRQCMPISRAPVELEIAFRGYDRVRAGIVKWPMSVIRLTSPERAQLIALSDKILAKWRGYSDEWAHVISETNGTPHNTLAPIARRRGMDYEMDLVLRNNMVTLENPLGVFQPHAGFHNIMKNNIGLNEAMGLAVLPAGIKDELSRIKTAALDGLKLTGDLEKYAAWLEQISARNTLTEENIDCVLKIEIGKTFTQVLEHAGVFKRTREGTAAFLRFIDYVNQEG